MPQASHRPHRLTIAIFAVALLAAAGLFSSLATARTTKQVVKEANNSTLGRTVLTANNGLTLYSLSVEKNGKFICKGSCLKDWSPLVVAAGVKPTGPVALGTVKRPDGRRQVTFEGTAALHVRRGLEEGRRRGRGHQRRRHLARRDAVVSRRSRDPAGMA